MADDAPQSTALAVQQARPPRIITEDIIPIFDTAKFEMYGRIATVMAKASLVPDTLKGSSFEEGQANCFQVVELADRLGFSPFAVAQCASIVHGKLMLEGKLVAAALDAKLGLILNRYYTGEWGTDDYRIYVTDAMLDADQIAALKPHIKFHNIKIIDGSVGEWKTKEKNGSVKGNWLNQPDVQLQYRGDRTWARLNRPAIMLGIYVDDDFDDLRDRQEPRRPSLAAGPDMAALEGARASLVAPITPAAAAPDAPKNGQEATHVVAEETGAAHESDHAQDGLATPQGTHAEPDPAHAEDASKTTAPPDEVYLLAEEMPGEDGKRQTYKNGKPFSRATDKAAGRLKAFDLHAPAVAADEHPTETASAQAAEAQPDTSASAEPVSDATPAPTGSGQEERSESEPLMLDSEEPDEPLENPHPVLAGKMEIDGANSYPEIKAVINRVTPTDAYREIDETGKMLFRMAAWERYKILKTRGIEDGVVTRDVVLMSLWLEFGSKSKAEIDSLWGTFYASEVYKGLPDGWKRALAGLISKRKAALS